MLMLVYGITTDRAFDVLTWCFPENERQSSRRSAASHPSGVRIPCPHHPGHPVRSPDPPHLDSASRQCPRPRPQTKYDHSSITWDRILRIPCSDPTPTCAYAAHAPHQEHHMTTPEHTDRTFTASPSLSIPASPDQLGVLRAMVRTVAARKPSRWNRSPTSSSPSTTPPP